MATSFAFVTPVGASGNSASPRCTVARPAPAVDAGAPVTREPHVDVLWRMTTAPWARARSALVQRGASRALALLETALLTSTAFGMAVLTVIALAV